MKKIFTLILILLPLCVFAQSRESKQLYKQGIELYDAEKYEEALTYFQKSDSLDKAILKPTHKNYYRAELKVADCYDEIASQADDEGHYNEALNIQKNVVEIRKKVLGDAHPDYADALSDLAYYYDALGNYTEAIRLGTLAMEIRKKVLGEEHPDYAISLSNLACCYAELGNYSEAIRLETLAMEIRKKALGEDHPDYATSLNNLAGYYSELGNYTEAIRLGTLAIIICKKVLGEEHPDYANSRSNLAWYYAKLGNYNEAIRLETLAIEIKKKALGEEHPDCAISLSNLASYYSNLGNYTEAIRLGTLAIIICKKVLGEEHPYYATSLSNLAVYYSNLGNYTEAIRLETLAMEIRKKALGEEHPDCAISLSRLADINLITGKYDAATDYYRQCYNNLNAFILKTFASLTTKERNDFWKTKSYLFTKDLPYAAYEMSSEETPKNDINALAYDAQVFSKGLLLNAELEIQKLIEQSGDTVFANRYYKIQQDRAILDDLYQTSPENREMDVDSLAKVIDREEHLLVESSKALGDYTKNLSISWRDVQKNLKDNDLAIEFATVDDTVAKQMMYVALVLKKEMSAPEIVTLFSSDDFYDIKSNEYYTTPKLYNLVWQPLAKYLKDAKTVYFSPAGRIHTIGIEYLSGDDGKIFAEKYDTYRLSSTRELAINHTINPNRKATTYGGIQYEFSPDEWRSLRDVNDFIERSFRDIPQIADNLRGGASGMSYLDGTKLESAAIANLLRSVNYDVNALSDAAATEESFKMLSGSGIQIMHIGTHGFYESEGDMENAGYKFYTAASQQTDEDKALSCSGLFFAGANSALNPKRVNEIPEGADDGILTAKEISRLDFSGLDLVVLSACQTGLGEVTGEGVFGLQRGFKKAGAQTIVMSLWKVADEPTQLLMVEFFKNLTAGQSKRAAFLAAQQTVRAKYPNPLYWAAFVMVDGN